HPMNIQVLSDPSRDSDYVVRLKAAELSRKPSTEVVTNRLQIGKVETGHDRSYWHRIAQLSEIRTNPSAVIHTRKGTIRIELLAGDARGDQHGGPGYQIRDEINLRRYETGTVGMALSGKDTGGSQFFITHSPQPHLDGGYTVFGQVVEGMDVVNRIARGDRIEHVEIVLPK